ncbi:albumin-2 [Artemisia annua]|uniref:Albumin-2 n=1 Tax=Artemisia annua TaxID=35608 RepID=A0A2U1MIN4_ARTAN|nr:albumin-2 [Artemisia annua]
MMLSSMCRRFTRWTSAKNISHINRISNTQSHQQQREIRIYRPRVSYYLDDNMVSKLKERQRAKKEVVLSKAELDLIHSGDDIMISKVREWQRANIPIVLCKEEFEGCTPERYIDSAFRSSRTNEVYLFFKNEYLVLNYAPGTTNARVVDGPHYIHNGFHSLLATEFADHGIDAAFGCHGGHDESFIFSIDTCAKINYGTKSAKILEGPESIGKMFPFFKGTKFGSTVDAAFESSVPNQAYIFNGGEYALIDYIQRKLIHIRPIVDGFNCLQNTIFDSDIGAAFASHNSQEAYLFKGNSYVILHFTPGQTKDYIISGPKEIVPENWPSLVNILPRSSGVSGNPEYTGPLPDYDPNFFFRICGGYY